MQTTSWACSALALLLLSLPLGASAQEGEPSGWRHLEPGVVELEQEFFALDSAAFRKLLKRLERARADSAAREKLQRALEKAEGEIGTLEQLLSNSREREESYKLTAEARKAVVESLEELRPNAFEQLLNSASLWGPPLAALAVLSAVD